MQKRIHPDAIVTLEDVRRWLLEDRQPAMDYEREHECRKASIRVLENAIRDIKKVTVLDTLGPLPWRPEPLEIRAMNQATPKPVYDCVWRVKTRLAARFGSPCRVITRGGRNSCLVEFQADGYQVITSRNYVRKVKGAT